MPCQEIESWTFSGLVGAFLDLAITYFLLCASTATYLASKFLALFGLCLPCPCSGLFGKPNNSTNCWQKVLVDCPSEKISSVQFSVKSRFPFDSIWDENQNSESNVSLMSERNHQSGSEDETCCSSFQEGAEMGVGSVELDTRNGNEGNSDIKGKGVTSQKGGYGLRHRNSGATDNGSFSHISRYDSVQSDSQCFLQSPASITNLVNNRNQFGTVPVIPFDDPQNCDGNSSGDIDLLEKVSHGFELKEPDDEDTFQDKDVSPRRLKYEVQGELCLDDDPKNTIRILEQALEEEHTARAALYIELEKERSAAATAADEAMAMILRLQEEKASVEMDARQYQRMIEEKSAYDFEEMNILKEILLRREREKHFLEKEVETCRQLILGGEQSNSVQDIAIMDGKRVSSLPFSSDESVHVLQRLIQFISEKQQVEKASGFSEYKDSSIESHNCTLAFEKGLPIPEIDEVGSLKEGCIDWDPRIKLDQHSLTCHEINEESQDKELLSLVMNPVNEERELLGVEAYPQFNLSNSEEQRQSDSKSPSQWFSSEITETCDETKLAVPYGCDDSEKHEKDLHGVAFDTSPCVHDVHVIEDECNMGSEVRENLRGKLSVDVVLDAPQKCDSPHMNRLAAKPKRSCSDTTSGMGCSLSDLRRNSMSAVDFERFKIDNEVGWLQERLRFVQEGREKLNISIGNREKEKSQLQLLENIVSQQRKIRLLTEPGKAVRQASLPPSGQAMSKKWRWRSVSLGVNRST